MSAVLKQPEINLLDLIDEKFKSQIQIYQIDKNNFNLIPTVQPTIWFSEGVPSEVYLNQFKQQRNFHFVQKDSLGYELELNLSAKMLLQPHEFFQNPVETILNPVTKKAEIIFSKDFSRQDEKYKILEEIESAVNSRLSSTSLMYDIQSISDELMTNAIFHAQSIIENRKLHMEFGKLGNITVGVDDSRIVISCTDPHGTLRPEKLLERIYTCYTTDIAGTINQGKGGAGIGSFLVHGMSASYTIAVEENKRTFISATLPIKMSNKKRLALSKNIHCLFLKESQHG
jgi:hypothetical protein